MRVSDVAYQVPYAQILRFFIVGVVGNGILYAVYWLLILVGMEAKMAMSLIYGAGMLQTFVLNKIVVFKTPNWSLWALLRFLVTYAGGYAINFFMLFFWVDKLGYSALKVQCVAVMILAIYFFCIQKFWIFK